MDKTNICIATITLARNEGEEQILKESLQKLAALNIPVFVCDGGSSFPFLDFIRSIPHFTLLPQTRKGVQAQALNSLSAAFRTGIPFIFYTEPDKKDFFSAELHPLIKQMQTNDSTGIIMASRTASAFASFPSFQQMAETTINNCCAEIISKNFDYTYGPFLVNRKLVTYLEKLNTDVGWGWRPYIFSVANRLQYNVEALNGDFNCPGDQGKDDIKERIYRMRQLEQNIRGLLLSTEVTL